MSPFRCRKINFAGHVTSAHRARIRWDALSFVRLVVCRPVTSGCKFIPRGCRRAVKTGAAVSPTADVFLQSDPVAREIHGFFVLKQLDEVSIFSSCNLFFAIF